MKNSKLKKWANLFALDIYADGRDNPKPFDRILRLHLEEIDALIADDRTWPMLANALKNVGVLRRDGENYSSDHLRRDCHRERMHAQAKPPKTKRDKRISTPPSRSNRSQSGQAAKPKRAAIISQSVRARSPLNHTPEVTTDEIDSVLQRIRKSNS